MEIFENLAYEISDVLYKKNNPVLKKSRDYVDGLASNYLADEIISNVKRHAKTVTWAGVASVVPFGEVASGGALVASTWKMYYDINKVLGISFSENFLKSVAAGIASNLATNAAAFATMSVVNKIPVIGQVAGLIGGPVINRVSIYAAAASYLAILKEVVDYGDITEASFENVMSGNKNCSSTGRASSESHNAYRVREIIANILGVSVSRVNPHSSLTRDLGADDLDMVELIMEFEKQFDISIPDEVMDDVHTVRDAIRLIDLYT